MGTHLPPSPHSWRVLILPRARSKLPKGPLSFHWNLIYSFASTGTECCLKDANLYLLYPISFSIWSPYNPITLPFYEWSLPGKVFFPCILCSTSVFSWNSLPQLWEPHSSSRASCKIARKSVFLSKVRAIGAFLYTPNLQLVWTKQKQGTSNEDKMGANVDQEWKLRDLFQCCPCTSCRCRNM